MSDSDEHMSQRVLRQHHLAGLLSPAEVHLASTLARLGADDRPEVALATAYAARAPRRGDVAVDLTRLHTAVRTDSRADAEVDHLYWPDPQRWCDVVASSPLAAGEAAAVVVRGSLVFLRRYDEYERQVAQQVRQRARVEFAARHGDISVAAKLLQGQGADRQLEAVRVGSARALSIIIGGPGTGKTTTVAALLAELAVTSAGGIRVALAAPTGKAAARLGEAWESAAQALPEPVRRLVAQTHTSTVHRLIGWSTRGQPHYHRKRPLPYDVVIIDETSMVSLPLMARLLDAISLTTRLVLVGDAGQLSSVEAGNVLGDLVSGEAHGPLAHCVTELTISRRFDAGSPLDQLAHAVRRGDLGAARQALTAPDVDPSVRGRLTWVQVSADDPAARRAVASQIDHTLQTLVDDARAGRVGEALKGLTALRVLCAHRNGPAGVSSWNRWIESRLDPRWRSAAPWYPGRPVMVNRNDVDNGWFNGDLGVVIEQAHDIWVAFPAADTTDGYRLVAPRLLESVDTVHALTIHKSQGSEFGHVIVVLPPAASPLSSRDLLYTAITRATHHVTLIGDSASLEAAVTRRSHRTGALAERLAAADQVR